MHANAFLKVTLLPHGQETISGATRKILLSLLKAKMTKQLLKDFVQPMLT